MIVLASGTYVVGPGDGTVLVATRREGAASLVGHDLTLVATRWEAAVVVSARAPARSRVTATIDATSLEVLTAQGGLTPLTAGQRAEIEGNIRASVLRSRHHPVISFTSTSVDGQGRRGTLAGDLTVVGRTRPCFLTVTVARSSGASARVTATTAITQTDFGIKPYSAFLGTLRVRDVVEVAVSVRLPTGR